MSSTSFENGGRAARGHACGKAIAQREGIVRITKEIVVRRSESDVETRVLRKYGWECQGYGKLAPVCQGN